MFQSNSSLLIATLKICVSFCAQYIYIYMYVCVYIYIHTHTYIYHDVVNNVSTETCTQVSVHEAIMTVTREVCTYVAQYDWLPSYTFSPLLYITQLRGSNLFLFMLCCCASACSATCLTTVEHWCVRDVFLM